MVDSGDQGLGSSRFLTDTQHLMVVPKSETDPYPSKSCPLGRGTIWEKDSVGPQPERAVGR